MFFSNALAKWDTEKIISCTVLSIKADRCWIEKARRHTDVTVKGWHLDDKRRIQETPGVKTVWKRSV
jgi:hypothetical protein